MATTIKLYDTLSRTYKDLKPSDGQRFRFYCCGPTVYAAAHIGNFRTFLVQDVLRRALAFAGLNPFYVRNLTDVDDKTIRLSQEFGQSLIEFTERWTQQFHKDCEILNMVAPDEEPKATQHIAQQIGMIESLIDGGHAYVSGDGSVYYKVSSFKEYGKLAHINCEHLRTQAVTSEGGAANLADEYDREHVADFALWKAYKREDGPNAWDSPWGKGRPGWHIECSAMSREYLGDTFDLHGGGVDLTFPHHENEIAQSEGVTGKPFALHWFHGAHLRVEGEKMSKSLGNLYTVADILEKGHSPMTLRYLMISGHYRQPLNFTFDGLHAAESALQKLEKLVRFLLAKGELSEVDWPAFNENVLEKKASWGVFGRFWEALLDDLNVPAALGVLFSLAKELEHRAMSFDEAREHLAAFANVLYVLGLKLLTQNKIEVPEEVQLIAEERWAARQAKDFEKSDTLRRKLETLGWKVLDAKDNYALEPL